MLCRHERTYTDRSGGGHHTGKTVDDAGKECKGLGLLNGKQAVDGLSLGIVCPSPHYPDHPLVYRVTIARGAPGTADTGEGAGIEHDPRVG